MGARGDAVSAIEVDATGVDATGVGGGTAPGAPPGGGGPLSGGALSGDPLAGDFAAAAQTFALLSTPTRVRLLWELARSEHDVSTLAAAVGATVPAVSQHLAKLRLAGLVSARAEGRRQIYRVEDPHIVELVGQGVDHHVDLRVRGAGG